MKKSRNLKIILVVEIFFAFCLCIGVAGIFIYASGPQTMPASGNPPAEAPTATVILTNVPTTEATATETPAITPTSETKGMALEKQPEKTIKFTDYDGGYEVTFPVGWLVVRPDDDEFNTALAKEGAKNAMLASQMKMDKSGYDAELDRVFSYPVRPDIKKNVIFGFSKTHFYPKDDVPINNNSMGDFVRKLEASGVAPGLRITASNIEESGNKISFMVVKGRFIKKTDSGDMIPFSVTALFFKPTPSSLALLTFTILQDFQGQISPDLNLIQESIKLLGQ
jgi:hypothetical protein